MKTKVYIHREEVETQDTDVRFWINLPKDCQSICGIQTAVQVKVTLVPASRRYVMGQLSISADNNASVEMDVLHRSTEPQMNRLSSPSVLENQKSYTNGKVQKPLKVHFTKNTRQLNARYKVVNPSGAYTLVIVIYYQ
jgi:hypothetical protein